MEDQIKEALHNAGMTEEELTANGEAAKKAMEAKAEAAAASEAKDENKNPEVQEDGKETDMNTANEKKWDVKRIAKWTAITIGCIAVGIGAALLLKNREAVAAAAESTAETTE